MTPAKLSLASLVWFTLCSGQNHYVVFYAGSGSSSTDLSVYLSGSLEAVAQINNAPPGVFQIVYAPDGKNVYLLANGGGAALAAADGRFQNLYTIVRNFAAAPMFAALQPNGRRLIVAAGRVYFLDTATNAFEPFEFVAEGTPFHVAVGLDSRKAFVLSRIPNGVSTILTSIDLVRGFNSMNTLRFSTGQDFEILAAPNGLLYLSTLEEIHEVDPDTLRVTNGGTLRVRGHPSRGVATPDGRYLVFANRQPSFGNNSIIALDLATRELSYVANVGLISKFVPMTNDSPETKLQAYAADGQIFELSLRPQASVLRTSTISSRFQIGDTPPIFRRLTFSSEIPPNRMWFTPSGPSKLTQAGLRTYDHAIQERPIPEDDREVSVVGPALTSGASRLLGFNTAQYVSPGARAPLPLIARLVDAFGRPIFDKPVVFRSEDPTVSIHTSGAITGSDGFVQTFVTAPSTPGTYRILAYSNVSSGEGMEFRVTVTDSANLRIVSGDLQQALRNLPMPRPLTVKVTDRNGAPIAGQRVQWSITGGPWSSVTLESGTLGAAETVTNSLGVSENSFRANHIPCRIQVEASLNTTSPPSTVTFRLESLSTAVGSLVVGRGNWQRAETGNEFAEQLTVRLVDVNGELLSNFPVDFSATDGLVVSSSRTLTNEFGEASIRVRAGVNIGTFNVVAHAYADGGAAQAIFSLTVTRPTGLRFVPVPPCRVLDTRQSGGPLNAQSQSVVMEGLKLCGQAPPNASAYAINVTVVPRGRLSFITLWPTGGWQPQVSTLNSLDGRVKANAAIVPAGDLASVSLFATDTTDAIIDLTGYFVPPPQAVSSGLMFYPLAPCRLFDTRTTSTPLNARETRNFNLSACINSQVPVGAVSLNATVIPRGPFGFLTLWPDGTPQPTVSTLNALTGTVTANAAIVQVPSNGILKMYGTDAADVVMDVNGFFGPPSIATIPNGAMHFYPITPCRISDTRLAAGPFGGPALAAAAPRTIPVPQGQCGIPATAAAYVLNATVVPNGIFGFLTLWPTGLPQPTVSTLNAVDGFVTSNMAIVRAGTNGSIDVFGSNAAHVVLDISGYFAP